MTDDPNRDQDTKERVQEQRAGRREAEERETEQHAPVDRAGREERTEESLLEGLPGSTANKPTG